MPTRPFLRAEFEKVPVGGDAAIAVREFKMRMFARGWHFHPEHQLTHILEGEGKRFIGDSIEAFAPGDLVLIGGNLPHYWRSDRPPPRRNGKPHGWSWSRSLTIQFTDDVIGRAPEASAARKLLDRARRGQIFHGKTRDAVAGKMRRMLNLSGLDRLTELLAIFNLLAQSREVRPLSSAGFMPQLDGNSAHRINLVHQFVFEHFHEPIYLKDVSRVVGLSPAPFCRFFHKATGHKFSHFLNEVRIGHACKLLLETDQTIGQVCYACGFNNLSNFNRRFRELKTHSPSEYRQAIASKSQGMSKKYRI